MVASGGRVKRLSARRLEVLQFVHRFRVENDYGPTRREVADGLGLASTSGVTDHLEALERRGLVRLHPGKSRAICLTEAGVQLVTPRQEEGALP